MKLQLLLAAAGLFALFSTSSAQNVLPSATRYSSQLVSDELVEEVLLDAIDLDAVRAEDVERQNLGLAPRYAIPNVVRFSPFTHGSLELVNDDTLVWRMRFHAPLATSINLGFEQYRMPEGGQLLFYSGDRTQVVRPFTHADNKDHGELWTPIIRGAEAVVELTIPAELFDDNHLLLELTHIGYGYRGFGGKDGDGADSGSCNVDVVCPDGDDWRDEIPAIAVISTGGSTFCTGFMVNNTANDRTPFFMTANHCGIGSGNAASLVVFWNYETTTCGGPFDGTLNEFNTGSTHRASYGTSDFTLVELDDDPDSEWGVTYAGWDRSGADHPGAIAIHQPSTDEKRISFENQPTTTTSYLNSSVPGNGSHVRIEDWDIGTTEPGSSGSPLFSPGHKVIGQLHGGYAACGNNLDDWYGKFSVSWTGGGSSSSRLSDWLDPGGTGAMTVDTLGVGVSVMPSGGVAHEGQVGGPFTNPSTFYTLSNTTPFPLSYSVSLANGTEFLIDGGTSPVAGVLAASGGSVMIEVTLSAATTLLTSGIYTETITVDDQTNGIMLTRGHLLEVGRTAIYSFNMDTDPGWTMQGGWEYGIPLGGGGSFETGAADPTAGATGANVLGYNLAGNYADNIFEEHVVSLPINCTGATGVKLRFKRWLNVDKSSNDKAFIHVSNDGSSFTSIWSNSVKVTDSSWVEEEYDISAIADGQATVYLRWTMGSTNASFAYSGWNIDDVELSAVAPAEFQTYGTGFAGSGGIVPTLTGTGSTKTDSIFNLNVTGGLGGASSILFIGLIPDNVPAFGGAFLTNSIIVTLTRTLSDPTGMPGTGNLALNVVFTDPTLVGLSLYLQTAILDPGAIEGIAFTNGLHLFATY